MTCAAKSVCHRACCWPVTLIFALALCLSSTAVTAYSSQHGVAYRHLDCSSCLAVAAVLATRMNLSAREAPKTFLLSQRLDTGSARQRREYRTSELRAYEVLDGICDEELYKLRKLRLNPRSKVRGYHLVDYGDLKSARRGVLLEEDVFPVNSSVAEEVAIKMLPMAIFYSAKELAELSLVHTRAPVALCDGLLAEYEDELGVVVRYTDYLSDVEEQICGLRSDFGKSGNSSSGAAVDDAAELHTEARTLTSPLLDVCADEAALVESSRRDQARWLAHDRRQAAKSSARARKVAARARKTGNAHASTSDL